MKVIFSFHQNNSTNGNENVGFEVLTAVAMKSSIFWDITPYGPLKVYRRCGEAKSSACYPLHARFLLGSFFDPEDGGEMFLRNVG
jgi:hypothetical protein